LTHKICIIGLGYVGLPIAVAAAESGNTVYGYDTNLSKVSSLELGISYIEDVDERTLKELLNKKSLIISKEPKDIDELDTLLICVPTPLSSEREPDLSALLKATKLAGEMLRSGMLVIVESTVEPGTITNVVLPLLVKTSGLASTEFFVSFSPERIDPGNKVWNLKNTTKLVSGINQISTQRAMRFYQSFVNNLFECSTIEVAETAKLLENTFRLINISFINELSIFCDIQNIPIGEVIAAASTKPYGFMPFYPSIGVGGHCIPVDPIYLASAARKVGSPTRFIDLANQVNQEMPMRFVNRAIEKIGNLNGKKILVIGIAYKANVADVRESQVASLISELRVKGATVVWHDDLVKEWNNEKSVTLSSDFDLAIIATPHDNLELAALGNVPILNTRGYI
jgi:UDP-N-acetyl-D-glucosamine dehydrogenase